MGTPHRTLRASDEVWLAIQSNAEKAGLSVSEYLRQAGQQALGENAAVALRFYVSEAVWVLVQIRNRIKPASLREGVSYPNEDRLAEVIEELKAVARRLPKDYSKITLDLVPEPLDHIPCECQYSELG